MTGANAIGLSSDEESSDCSGNQMIPPNLCALSEDCGVASGNTLGKWQCERAELELKEEAKPCHARPHPMPKCHANTLQMEADCQVEMGALKQVNCSVWAVHHPQEGWNSSFHQQLQGA